MYKISIISGASIRIIYSSIRKLFSNFEKNNIEFWFKEIKIATCFKCRILIKFSSEDNLFWIYQNIYDATSVVCDWCCSSCLLLTKNIARRIDEIIQIFIETNSYPWTWTLNSHKNTTQSIFLRFLWSIITESNALWLCY